MTRLWMGVIARYALEQTVALTQKRAAANVPPVGLAKDPHLFNIDQHGRLIDEKRALNFLDTPFGTSVFPLVQATLAAPATFYIHQGNLAVVFAVGDALASPHFLSGTGLATARIAVEWGIAALARHYTGSKFGSVFTLHNYSAHGVLPLVS